MMERVVFDSVFSIISSVHGGKTYGELVSASVPVRGEAGGNRVSFVVVPFGLTTSHFGCIPYILCTIQAQNHWEEIGGCWERVVFVYTDVCWLAMCVLCLLLGFALSLIRNAHYDPILSTHDAHPPLSPHRKQTT